METLHPPSGRRSSFGTLLHRYRQAAGLTQEELAERASLSARNLRGLERGAPRRPQRTTIEQLAAALSVPPAEHAAFVAAARGHGSPRPEQAPSPAGMAPPFVGRARELALIDRHLAGQGPPVLLLAGEPGIGKSRLLQAAAARGAGQGLRVLAGGCQRQGGQAPYSPLLEALQRHLEELRPAELRAALSGCAWLVRLLPELADGPIEPLPAWTLPPEQERRLMFAAVIRFLTNVAGPGGVLLVLDDLQWAGADALALLGALTRAAPEIPMRVVGAYRDTEVQSQDSLSVLLADLAHAGLAARRLLAPLSAEEAAQLLAGLSQDTDADATLRARVLERAGGVPFFLISSAQELRRRDLDGAGEDGVPWNVAQSVRQRVATLPDGAGEVLGAAAVIGRVVHHALLLEVIAQPEHAVLTVLEAACGARLLEEAAGAYHFAHDVVREVVEADLGAARRAVLHQRTAVALERRPGELPVETLAYHYARSDAQDRALLYLERAGDRAEAQYAHATTERYYREVIRRLDALGRSEDAAQMREKLMPTLYRASKFDGALLELEQAVATYQAAGDREGVWRSVAQIGRMHAARDAAEAGLARLRPVVPALEEAAPSRGAAQLWAALAWLFVADNLCHASIAAGERAAHQARVLGDHAILLDVEIRRGAALLGLGRLNDARQVLEAALPLVETMSEPIDAIFRVLINSATIYTRQGAFDRCRQVLDWALREADRVDIAMDTQWALAGLGELLFLQGDWSEARAYLERSAAVTRSAGWWLMAGATLVRLARLHLACGDRPAAAHCLEEPHLQRALKAEPELRRLLAERDLLEGQPAAALTRLSASGADGEDPDVQEAVLLAWARLELGEDARAAALLARVLPRARSERDHLTLVDALRVRALLCARQRRWDDAARDLEEGIALARGMPYPYAEARLLHAYGRLHSARGAAAPARERLAAALAIFRRLGARSDVERVEQDLATLLQPTVG